MDCNITSCTHLRAGNTTGQYSTHCRILHGHKSHSQYSGVPSSVCACTNSSYAALPPDMPISISFSLSHSKPVLHPAPASGPPLQTLKSQGYHAFRLFCLFIIFPTSVSRHSPPCGATYRLYVTLAPPSVGFADLKRYSHHFFCIAVYVT
jgi:hypothetical protein